MQQKKRNNIEVRVEVDRHTGEFNTFRRWLVIEEIEKANLVAHF